jgi:Alpha 1,4-glycosyltransferase conserved region
VPIFRTFFFGEMSGFEITCLKSFLDYGHRVIIFAYDETEIPPLFERRNAAFVLPRHRVFYYRHGRGAGSVAAFANLFRYTLLERYGDWWIDTDVLCQSSKWPSGECVAAWESEGTINNAVLKLPADIAKLCRMRCQEFGQDVKWGQAGPALVTHVLRERDMLRHVLPARSFYPVRYQRWADFMDENKLEVTQQECANAVAVHLWHEMMRRGGVDKRRLPPDRSFFGRAVRKHRTGRYFRK